VERWYRTGLRIVGFVVGHSVVDKSGSTEIWAHRIESLIARSHRVVCVVSWHRAGLYCLLEAALSLFERVQLLFRLSNMRVGVLGYLGSRSTWVRQDAVGEGVSERSRVFFHLVTAVLFHGQVVRADSTHSAHPP
jgi:hypothetical protein